MTPLPSVGPQAWLAEAVGNLPAARENAPPPPAPPAPAAPLAPPPTMPTRELPLPGRPAAQAPAPVQAPPPVPPVPPVPLVTARRRPARTYLVAGGLALALGFVGALAAAGVSGPPAEPGAGAPQEAGNGGGAAVAGTGSAAPLQPVSVRATCQAPSSADSLGNQITYEPQLTLDALGATAWRCAGAAVGQRLVYDFGAPVTVTSVGLVPGYAKVDPADGTDRFLENRTVTEVAWRFDDGTVQRQSIASPTPAAVDLGLPGGVRTRQVVLEIAGTGNDAAIRDFTAISDVRFAGH
ncbi:discoidin domain-containing protein [Blastococcus sp. KM273129]|uniref:discoidin domain-containing protein n=1 Tax=Blastococcus sp. KM273129 TaxID=2570315 RepID=UPI001F34C5CD|nr:discoidin domain-containing protein [Blastococcus sp. KM273129]MCF6736954.1 discoidin domain-containing protein [Blastococcus sp. KM273129]